MADREKAVSASAAASKQAAVRLRQKLTDERNKAAAVAAAAAAQKQKTIDDEKERIARTERERAEIYALNRLRRAVDAAQWRAFEAAGSGDVFGQV